MYCVMQFLKKSAYAQLHYSDNINGDLTAVLLKLLSKLVDN